MIDATKNETVFELGSHIHERVTPCSTFKIVLSLIGFDAGILKDEKTPTWDFQEGYDDYLDSWKLPQNPQSWLKNSCIWYSRVLVSQLGMKRIQNYLQLLDYGNKDTSGGLSPWLSSSLKISLQEQVEFIRKIVRGNLPISSIAIQMTKSLLYMEELSEGWKLFGKTGLGEENNETEIGWFVGWVEKDENVFVFAYNIRDTKINPARRIPRVKQLLAESMRKN